MTLKPDRLIWLLAIALYMILLAALGYWDLALAGAGALVVLWVRRRDVWI